jgi:hypothetical protein
MMMNQWWRWEGGVCFSAQGCFTDKNVQDDELESATIYLLSPQGLTSRYAHEPVVRCVDTGHRTIWHPVRRLASVSRSAPRVTFKTLLLPCSTAPSAPSSDVPSDINGADPTLSFDALQWGSRTIIFIKHLSDADHRTIATIRSYHVSLPHYVSRTPEWTINAFYSTPLPRAVWRSCVCSVKLRPVVGRWAAAVWCPLLFFKSEIDSLAPMSQHQSTPKHFLHMY